MILVTDVTPTYEIPHEASSLCVEFNVYPPAGMRTTVDVFLWADFSTSHRFKLFNDITPF